MKYLSWTRSKYYTIARIASLAIAIPLAISGNLQWYEAGLVVGLIGLPGIIQIQMAERERRRRGDTRP